MKKPQAFAAMDIDTTNIVHTVVQGCKRATKELQHSCNTAATAYIYTTYIVHTVVH